MIHVLHRMLGLPGDRPGVIFNMSVGYNMEGILKPNMQRYLDLMEDVSERRDEYVALIEKHFPQVREVDIPARISDNVTLSTMHGCPPEEIEQISAYLIKDRGLHTSVKLNPTLLGPERLRRILNDDLGYKEVVVPDIAFEHDLKYADAVPMLERLQASADTQGVQFGVKLTNTLEVENTRDVFAENEKMMYMSGRSLHAVSVNLAAKLAEQFSGRLMMSFSAGADAFNVADLLACGMRTVTVCSDILKPGSYTRLRQYLECTATEMSQAGAGSLAAFACARAGKKDGDSAACALDNLRSYAAVVLKAHRLQKHSVDASRTKTTRKLGLFDCIVAPCVDECPINQKVPQYMTLVREGRFDEAVEITRADNPLPTILGRACNHLCENVCLRTHYDEPLAIREMKRFIMAQEQKPHFRKKSSPKDVKVAVIGGGPCGLSVAYFLGQAGYKVTIFEARPYTGGMVSGTIPAYRAAQAVIDQDMQIIKDLGVEFRYSQAAGKDFTLKDLHGQGFKYVAIGVGAQKGKTLGVEGEDADGVLDALEFLRSVREENPPPLGERIGVIGGGDVAMDCARSAWRLTGNKVMIVYRRTIEQMPAAREEIEGVLEEGIEIMELVKPVSVVVEDGKMTGLIGLRMKLGDEDSSGRRRPVDIPGSEFTIPLDNLIVAISQEPVLDFLAEEKPETTRKGYLQIDPETMETSIPNVFAGGDIALDGPESIVKALGDGRKIAENIQRREQESIAAEEPATSPDINVTEILHKRSRRKYRVPLPKIPPGERKSFEEVEQTLSEGAAREEADRCLDCHLMCSTCVSVCPNLAFMTYRMPEFKVTLPKVRLLKGEISFAGGTCFEVTQPFQVAVLTDFCNECGNCATFCPTSGEPYKDKPRLYLTEEEFLAQDDNAFMFHRRNGSCVVRGRFGGETHELRIGAEITYETPKVKAEFDEALELKHSAPNSAFKEGEEISLEPCAIMYALHKGIAGSLPHLPAATG